MEFRPNRAQRTRGRQFHQHLDPFHTYARMLRIAADALSVAIREGSVLYAYCIRTVSVDFRPDPQPNFESDFMFHVCCG